MKSNQSLVILITFLQIFSSFSQVPKCELKQGCILRSKFFAHVTYQKHDGSPLPLKSALNYKIIYSYRDRLVFYSSTKSTENGLELEQDMTKPVDEMNIERIINFAEIILDCGKYRNKLCHAQSYPQIESVPFFKKIKKAIPTNPDIKCITIPFYENSYKVAHEKVAFICINEMRQLIQLIDFKNTLSRSIESYQMRLADDRFSAFNGLRRAQTQLIYFKDNKPQQVIGRLYGKRIDLVTNDKTAAFIKDFSLYQTRFSGVFFATEALKRGLIQQDWNKNFEWPTTADCCLALPGETDSMILCAASNDGRKLEAASDICKVKLEPFKTMIKIQARGIRLTEFSYALLADRKKFNNCKSKEYKVFRNRVDYALTKQAVEECRTVLNYGEMPNEDKFRYCFKHYGDEMKMEINLLANDNSALYNKFSECFYVDPYFKAKLSKKYLRNLLGLKVFGPRKSSFLASKEVDEIDSDDDAAVDDNKKNVVENKTVLKKNENNLKPAAPIDDKKITFAQVKETVKKSSSAANVEKKDKKKSKQKEIERIMYHKKKPVTDAENVRKKLFRIKNMNVLQNEKVWRHSLGEGMTKKYSKIIANQGNRNADAFVGFLGFLRDNAYDGNQNVLQVETERFFRN